MKHLTTARLQSTWVRALLSVVVALNLGVGLAAITGNAAFGQSPVCRVHSVGCHSVPVGCHSIPRGHGGDVGRRSRPTGCESEPVPVGCNSRPFPDGGQVGRRSRPVGCESQPTRCLPGPVTNLQNFIADLLHRFLPPGQRPIPDRPGRRPC